jgi:hypothetical protein
MESVNMRTEDVGGRHHHAGAVRAFLARHVASGEWTLELPPSGHGQETFIARLGLMPRAFVKVGAAVARAQAMADLDLTPAVLAHGTLADGNTVLAHTYLAGRRPRPADLRARLDEAAGMIGRMHASGALLAALPAAASSDYRSAGERALARLRARWDACRPLVSEAAAEVEAALAELAGRIDGFTGAGLVASHNDINNSNWILADAGRLFLVDLEMMAPEDPACDLGAFLWWYFPPAARGRFLEVAGYADVSALRERMRVRQALHSLAILLPRPGSFDRFDPAAFDADLADFRALVAGRENPQGYGD